MKHVALVLIVTTILLTGCLSPDPDDDPDDTVQPEGMAFGALSGLPAEPGPRNLTQAPLWAVGEWWTYRLEAPGYDEQAEVTIVVAGADEEHYFVGQPIDDDQVLPYIMHIPGAGEISRADLSWEAHDKPWKLLDFPLEEGHSWQGVYWGGVDMELEVSSVDGDVATLTLTRETSTATITYDAQVGNLVTYEETYDSGLPNFSLKLLEHGFNHTGETRIAYDQDLLICHGTAMAALGIADCAVGDPGPPQGTFDIPDGYDAATIALVVNPGAAEDQRLPGTYRITVIDPHGNQRQVTHATGSGIGTMMLQTVDDPAGTWEYESVAAGGGFAIVEGITHRVIEVDLPSGCLLSQVPEDSGLPACLPEPE